MKVFINWLSFISGVIQNFADSLKTQVPKYDAMKAANKVGKFAEEVKP